MNQTFLNTLEDQIAVGFTGRINILDRSTKQYLGQVLLLEGSILHLEFQKLKGEKAFYTIYLKEYENATFSYVVEPELVDGVERSVHFPYSNLKQRLQKIVEDYEVGKQQKPPGNLKVLINPEFIKTGEPVTNQEFELLATISDYNMISDIYKNVDLLDYEVTMALVSLRKKGALKVIKTITE
jgi:hypothetical protein